MAGWIIYLIIVNAAAFLLYTIDYKMYQNSGNGFQPQFLLNLSTIIGGSLGTILAFIVWDHKVSKKNIQSRVYAVVWLVIHVLAVLAFFGPNKDKTATWFTGFYEQHKVLCIYYLVINIVTFFVFAIDKIKAQNKKSRIRVAVLFLLSLIGGAVGGLLAMDLLNHKSSQAAFLIGIPLIIIMHLMVLFALGIGILQ